MFIFKQRSGKKFSRQFALKRVWNSSRLTLLHLYQYSIHFPPFSCRPQAPSFTMHDYFSIQRRAKFPNIKFCYSEKWVPVAMARRVLRLRMGVRPPVWRVAANILNKQSQTADKGWSCSLGFWQGANSSSPQRLILLRIIQTGLGPGLTVW